MSHWCRTTVFSLVLIACAVPCFAENARQLTFPPPGFSDAWAVYSPRGDKVAFGRIQNGVAFLLKVFVADVATGVVDTLIDVPTGFNPTGGLQWSPDGRQILFNFDTPGTGLSVWVADVPGPVVPKIVASCPNSNGTGRYSLDSNGTIYFFGSVTPGCPAGGIEIEIKGSMFDGGPPPSPVISLDVTGSLVAVLQNGDVWHTCGIGTVPPWTGRLAGNIFNAAGITAVHQPSTPPGVNRLAQNRPNPFNPATRIPFTLASPGRVAIRVYDASGRLVRTIADELKPAGAHTATWAGETDSGTKAGSGTYFLRITYPDGTSAEQKLTVLK